MAGLSFLSGGGGYSASSSAKSSVGPTSSGAGSVNVGGFNPPSLSHNSTVLILGAVVVAFLVLRR